MSLTSSLCIAVVLAGAASHFTPSKDKPGRAPIDLMWMVAPLNEGVPSEPQPANTAALRAKGVALFTKHCTACHGKRGDGNGPAAATLSVKPADFTKAIFKVRSTSSGTLPIDADLFGTISRGLHGTEMFPWANLSTKDRWALVQRVKSFSVRFRQEEAGVSLALPTQPPVESDVLRAKGKALYERLRCGACHGVAGGADGPAVQLYKDPTGARPVYIRDFKKGQFLRGSEMQDVFMTLRTGLDGTPMGPYDVLAAPDLWALSSYVRSLVQQRPLRETPPATP